MDSPYQIVDDKIIFKPQFNECLDNYSDIISNQEILYFSNYNNPHLTFKNNNIFTLDKCHLYSRSLFNQSLGNSLSKTHNLRKLTLGHNFNNSLDYSLSKLYNLRILTFGSIFNQPLGDSLLNLHNLRELTFGDSFNRPLSDFLPNLHNLRELTFGYYFNCSLDDSLSNLYNLEELIFDSNFNQPLIKFFDNNNGNEAPENDLDTDTNTDYFPGISMSKSLSNLNNLRKLIFGQKFNQPLNSTLSNLVSLQKLSLGSEFFQPIDIPYGIKN